MSANTVRLVACRAYGVLVAVLAVSTLQVGLMFLNWWVNGAPAEFTSGFGEVKSVELSTVLVGLGGAITVLGALGLVGAIFALLGRLWPLVAGTVVWSLTLALAVASTKGASQKDFIIFVTFGALTLIALLAKRAANAQPLAAR